MSAVKEQKMDLSVMWGSILKDMQVGMEPRLALLRLLDDTLDKEQRDFVTIHTPTIFTHNIHNECRGSNLHDSICCELMMHSSRKQKLYCLNPS